MRIILVILTLIYFNTTCQCENVDITKLLDLQNEISGHFYLFENLNKTTKYSNDLCLQDINEIRNGFHRGQQWALEFLDAWGKVPAGILWGNFHDYGNFDECLNASKSKGKYCKSEIPLKEFKGVPTNFTTKKKWDFSIVLGICIPSSCNWELANDMFKHFLNSEFSMELNETDQIIEEVSCSTNEPRSFDSIDIFAISVFSVVFILIVLSTIYDFMFHDSAASRPSIFTSFSILTNGKKLFNVPVKNSDNFIGCLNGIRCISMVWIILGNGYYVHPDILAFINTSQINNWYSELFSLLILNATVAVDSFFLISGLLISWIGFQELEKNKGKLNIAMMYFHRLIRITPPLAIVILFAVSLFKFTTLAPNWNFVWAPIQSICRENWWKNLLFIQNYDYKNEMCLAHTWYLAVDTQLFFISPILLLLTWKWEGKFLFSFASLASLISVGSCFVSYLYYEFSMTPTQPMKINDIRQLDLIYYPTHTRISPWIVGLVLGYYLFQSKEKHIKITKIFLFFGWSISLITIVAVLFGPYSRYQPGSIATTLEGALYESLSRVSWSIALAWIIFTCQKGYGGLINSFLSYSFFQVLGRLSYSMYLVHFIVIPFNSGRLQNGIRFSNYDMQNLFWSDFCVTFIVSIIMSLAFESPILGIEKAVFKK